MIEFINTSINQYYGLDFAAMILAFLSFYYLGNKNKIGFVFAIISSIFWIIINTKANIFAGIMMNVILIFMHIRGIFKWQKSKT